MFESISSTTWMIYGLMLCHFIYNFLAVDKCKTSTLITMARITLAVGLIGSFAVPTTAVIGGALYLCVCYVVQCVISSATLYSGVDKATVGTFWLVAGAAMWSLGLRVAYELAPTSVAGYIALGMSVILAIVAVADHSDTGQDKPADDLTDSL